MRGGNLRHSSAAASGGADLEEPLAPEAGLERRHYRVAPLTRGRDIAADAAEGLRTGQTPESAGDLLLH